MPYNPEYHRNGDTPDEVMNTYPTFLHPDGLVVLDAYTTPHDFTLPAEQTSRQELEALKHAVATGELPLSLFPDATLPSLQQLARITVLEVTGCWELPVYKNGEDVYPPGSPLAGRPRARYGNLAVAGVNQQGKSSAHRTMYAIFRGSIPDDKYQDHQCDNKQCCWHRHTELVTPGENTKRGRESRLLAAGQMKLFRQPRQLEDLTAHQEQGR